MRPAPIAFGMIAGGLLLMATREAGASTVNASVSLGSGDAGQGGPASPAPEQGAVNVKAFLDAIGWAEGTDGAGGYRALYGSRSDRVSVFDSFADHPAALGWPGVRLTNEQCAGAGFGPGCVSTAAGRYQIIRPTWERVAARLALADFTPASQDAAAIELIREAGALELVIAGRLADAARAVRRVWASMPGAGYAGQGERTLLALTDAYRRAGGLVA